MRSSDSPLLGGLTPAQFMRRHWQKSPHLVRRAIPDFVGIIDRKALFELAGRDEVESRLVMRGSGRKADWTLEHGPFRAADFRSLPPTHWTLLVQGIDQHVDAGAALLQRFSFIPFARVDDLMISYAVPGGGVGPHFDSSDVFLLQGQGRRQWRTSDQQDLRLQAGVPLKILSHFTPTQRSELDPGDMLYLPPSIAHDGVALTECMTYSIGFRAPTTREVTDAFLQFLPDTLSLADERYGDPDLRATVNPARIGAPMQRRLTTSLRAIRWSPSTIAQFIGCMLSEPKIGVVFHRPESPQSPARFAQAARAAGSVRVDRRTRMLYDNDHLFINGEVLATIADHPSLTALADQRRLRIDQALPPSTLELLHREYLNGALHVGSIGEP